MVGSTALHAYHYRKGFFSSFFSKKATLHVPNLVAFEILLPLNWLKYQTLLWYESRRQRLLRIISKNDFQLTLERKRIVMNAVLDTSLRALVGFIILSVTSITAQSQPAAGQNSDAKEMQAQAEQINSQIKAVIPQVQKLKVNASKLSFNRGSKQSQCADFQLIEHSPVLALRTIIDNITDLQSLKLSERLSLRDIMKSNLRMIYENHMKLQHQCRNSDQAFGVDHDRTVVEMSAGAMWFSNVLPDIQETILKSVLR